MTVTQIEPVTKAKSRIYVDNKPEFLLYSRELSRYQIREGKDLPEETFRVIVEEVLTKRAKQRAMYLLKSMDRTEYQLRLKLEEGEYPREAIDQAIAYVQSFHYLDDRRYAENYVESRKGSMSRRELQQKLYQRGIPKALIQEALEGCEPDQEKASIQEWMRKKHYNPQEATLEEQRRMYGFLLRKGFRTGDVLACMHMEWE
ncbi:MAG: recombination regulator RecX [Lachnospiraceae bacterium]|nr:recombination regulator RecX [Lachnospiraceae bacterium]MDD7024245.1 regulatory protein RecX [Oscillospiraceae bacterium]MDY5540146.1 regulatory protein RecX [Lachnospiraceae bacterium]MDY5648154.1 regulatory protein RecX [Lachnospiraceae bacterium]